MAFGSANETFAFVDFAGDDDAPELSAELVGDAALDDADDLIEHFADDPPPEERVQARTNDARTLIDTAPRRGLSAVAPPDLARLERRHEVQGRLKEAVETFDTTSMRADVQRQWVAFGANSTLRLPEPSSQVQVSAVRIPV